MPKGQYQRFTIKRTISRTRRLSQVDQHIRMFQMRKKKHEQAIISLERKIEERKRLAELAQTHVDYCLDVRTQVETADDFSDIPIAPWHVQQSETIKETWSDPETHEEWVAAMNGPFRKRKGV